MAILQPTGTNLLNAPSHSKAHRVWAWDDSAPDKSCQIDSVGYGPWGIDVRAYGADPTGVADSTTAIQNAINAATGNDVYLPVGTYKTTSTLTLDF
jgi:hypothetical protein